MKKLIKQIKKKLQNKPMIYYRKLALATLVFANVIGCGLIILLNYEYDEYILTSMIYVILDNIIMWKALNILWR